MDCLSKKAVDRQMLWATAEMAERTDFGLPFSAEKPLRALIVEPDPTLLAAIGGMFRAVGCETVLASSPENAVQIATNTRCDLIVVDHDIALSGDRQLVPIMNELSPRAKIVVMTAWCTFAESDIMIITKSDGWLFKPFGLADMLEVFSRLGLPFFEFAFRFI